MTTSNDGVQPNPGDQQQPDPAAVAAAAAAQHTPTEPVVVDPDEQEVKDAIAAAEAEKAAGAGADGTAVDPATQQQQQPGQQQEPAAQGQQSDAVMIPKARLDEALGKASKAETDAAYWRGVAEARGQTLPQPQAGQQGGQQQTQQPTAEQRLAALHAEQDALAAKYDNGEITMADMTKAQRDLTNKEQAIREEILVAKVKPADSKPEPQNDELYLDTLTAQLEAQHPWVSVFEKAGSPIDWKYVTDQAKQNLVDRGVDPTKGTIGRYELRKEVASLMDQLGPAIVGDRAKAKGIAIPGQQQPSQGGQQQPVQLSPQARARAAALEKQENAPPNLRSMSGNADDGSGVPTDTRLEHMSEDEIGALPESTRRKLLGTL